MSDFAILALEPLELCCCHCLVHGCFVVCHAGHCEETRRRAKTRQLETQLQGLQGTYRIPENLILADPGGSWNDSSSKFPWQSSAGSVGPMSFVQLPRHDGTAWAKRSAGRFLCGEMWHAVQSRSLSLSGLKALQTQKQVNIIISVRKHSPCKLTWQLALALAVSTLRPFRWDGLPCLILKLAHNSS